jgi:carbonic anhydrase/acetyltransferase-like protein (isoleucine patch superfamily)
LYESQLIAYRGNKPTLAADVFVGEGSLIIGDVEIGAGSSVWFNCTVRGDVNIIRIGERVNIQDGSILHVTRDVWPLHLGDDVSLGHGVMLHGCTIDNSVLVGMRAVVLDGAQIGTGCLIAAGALVAPGKIIPPDSVVMGVPGKVVRSTTDAEKEMIANTTTSYLDYVEYYRNGGHP